MHTLLNKSLSYGFYWLNEWINTIYPFDNFFQYKVPANDTTYSCRIFDLSKLGRKHHLVKVSVYKIVGPKLPLICAILSAMDCFRSLTLPIYLFSQFEVLVENGHEALVHHILVHKCPGISRSQIDSPNYICYRDPDLTKQPCGRLMVVWAVGGEVRCPGGSFIKFDDCITVYVRCNK